MEIQDLMTETPVYCAPNTPLRKVARLMAENDCGALPVFANNGGRRIIGVITDRDIIVRAVAEGKLLNHTSARDVMTRTPVTVAASDDVDAACVAMAANQVRRVLVADGDRACVGIIAQADLARHLPAEPVADTLKRVSRPGGAPAAGPLSPEEDVPAPAR